MGGHHWPHAAQLERTATAGAFHITTPEYDALAALLGDPVPAYAAQIGDTLIDDGARELVGHAGLYGFSLVTDIHDATGWLFTEGLQDITAPRKARRDQPDTRAGVHYNGTARDGLSGCGCGTSPGINTACNTTRAEAHAHWLSSAENYADTLARDLANPPAGQLDLFN